MPVIFQFDEEIHRRRRTNQVVISSATIMSSLRIRAVNEMETMFKNSFSNKRRDMIMIAAPVSPQSTPHR